MFDRLITVALAASYALASIPAVDPILIPAPLIAVGAVMLRLRIKAHWLGLAAFYGVMAVGAFALLRFDSMAV